MTIYYKRVEKVKLYKIILYNNIADRYCSQWVQCPQFCGMTVKLVKNWQKLGETGSFSDFNRDIELRSMSL